MKPSPLTVRWTNASLFRLSWPLLAEQLLAVSIGMADTIMVSTVGESAVSGVSLVDAINVLLITIFASLSTGGAVVASQYLGRGDASSASKAGCQLLYAVTAGALGIAIITLFARQGILQLVYGHITPAVMQDAKTYLWISALGYPFIGIYNAGAALFRSMGNSKMGMAVAFMINLLNIGGNALLISVLKMGVAGAAVSTLVSRAAAAAVLVWALMRHGGPISLSGLFSLKIDAAMIKRILRIGIPSGLENSTFLVGKLMVARIISTFGTAAIAGNAIASAISTICNLPGQSMGLATLTVMGQCAGGGDYAAGKRNTYKLMGAAFISTAFFCAAMLPIRAPLLALFNLSTEATSLAVDLLLVFCITAPLFWTGSFALPNALRAAGDVRYTMVASMASMWLFRIGSAFLLSYTFGLKTMGVWWAMVIDWVVRSACFITRWLRGKWQKKSVIGN